MRKTIVLKWMAIAVISLVLGEAAQAQYGGVVVQLGNGYGYGNNGYSNGYVTPYGNGYGNGYVRSSNYGYGNGNYGNGMGICMGMESVTQPGMAPATERTRNRAAYI